MRIAAIPTTNFDSIDAAKASCAKRWTLLLMFTMGSVAACGGRSPAKTGTGGQTAGATGTGTGGRAAGGATGIGGASGTGGRAMGGTTGTGGRATTGGATGTGGAPDGGVGDASVAAGGLGKACASTADCGGGLTCLLPTDKLIYGQGGPAHGYCTFPCSVAADDVACGAAGGNCFDLAVAATDPPEVYCMQTCPYGGADPVGKCHGRTDVGCLNVTTASPPVTACVPLCSQDSDCPSPRKCDPRYNVCVDTPTAGSALGAHCIPPGDAGVETCGGGCLRVGSATVVTASFCTTACVLGVLEGCNWVGPGSLATGGAHGVCVYAGTGAMAGDVGYCANECDTVNDCPDKTDPAPMCDPTFQVDIGHGICSWGAPAADAGTGG